MAYNMPGSSATQGPPFFEEMMNASKLYTNDDYLLEVQNSWIENIDPLLRLPTQAQQVWQSQQEPLQRFMTQPERNLFTAGPVHHHNQRLPQALNRPTAPISTLPQASRPRMTSPSPSQEQTSTTCSSARSPGPDMDWYNEAQYSPMAQPRDDYSLPNATFYLGQAFPDPWARASEGQVFSLPQVYSCLQHIQGLPDLEPEEATFDPDEGFSAIEVQPEYAIEVDSGHLKNGITNDYPCLVDEGIGTSIKDQSSPEATEFPLSQTDVSSEADADAEGEDDFELPIVDAISDPEYTPKCRPRKQRPSRNTSLNATKTGRITKLAAPKSRSNLHNCRLCNHSCKDAQGLQRHVAATHTRAFTCVFSFAGCPATFGSKNEWKRHVSSQHLNLHSWICNVGICAQSKRSKSSSGSASRGSEFNRKDLFTQHLRRMHTPAHLKNSTKKDREWEDKLKDLGRTCMVSNRQAPTRLGCPVEGCGTIFEGNGAWDERMEHVGRHLEVGAKNADSEAVYQENDYLLIRWAVTERIIEPKPGHARGYRLVIGGGASVGDEDAEGEDE
ncbi:uncharacterized protein BP5553_05074 [Venustampulla echinocandica]|uniref:C2H2-type domain-containing protein n=1 Tax=Venustampulla echinocandica TaxID=2656787 RepID=A0A370TQ43_9HELO|nr:uncharacterized protein BP5553_05074 [Venustampulla echinocandica]RDL37641.1 hypothetical protein BP5553_05074 [Venustampulla echinocandica]